MKYSGALQVKGLQSYKPSNFALTRDGTRASRGQSDFSLKQPRDPNDFWLPTLTTYNFATN